MPFKKGHYYKHVKSRDHVLYIFKFLLQDDGVIIWIAHINPGYTGKPWQMPGPKSYKIPVEHYKDYAEVPEEELYDSN